MAQRQGPGSPLGSLVAIGVVVGVGAAAFAYTAGWLSPQRLTPERMVAALGAPMPADLGHRRNHAKGLCFTGRFQANGNGVALSRAALFVAGSYPVVGRFNLGTPNPDAKDASARVRGLSIQIKPPGGQEWRSGMINAPFFPVSTPQDFYQLLTASGSKDPGAMPGFVAAHPGFVKFGAWAQTGPWTGSYAEERYNGLNAFRFVDASGAVHPVRWSMLPAAAPVSVDPATLDAGGPDLLEQEITKRVQAGPVRWTLQVTVADASDQTADPSKPWPDGRRTVDVGTLLVDQVQAEADGPCRDVNYDPTVLPDGIAVGDDPFPAARSAAYAVSFDRRTAEAADYPRTAPAPAPVPAPAQPGAETPAQGNKS
jgi:catalase